MYKYEKQWFPQKIFFVFLNLEKPRISAKNDLEKPRKSSKTTSKNLEIESAKAADTLYYAMSIFVFFCLGHVAPIRLTISIGKFVFIIIFNFSGKKNCKCLLFPFLLF